MDSKSLWMIIVIILNWKWEYVQIFGKLQKNNETLKIYLEQGQNLSLGS